MIVVTGMHRSGTSLVALMLRELGLDFGPESEMYETDNWNARGYLERADVVDLNSRAITGFDRTTGKPTQIASQMSYLVQSGLGGTERVSKRIDSLSDSVRDLGSKLESHAVKDPRFCLTFDAWERLAPIDGLVVALRHPSASVASLEKRNRIPSALGHRFWRWHMESILSQIDSNTLVLRQEDVVGDGLEESIDRAQRWLAERGVHAVGDPRSVVDRSLVHHAPSDDGLPEESLRLWKRFDEVLAFS